MLKTTVWRCAPKLAWLAVLLAMSWGSARAGADHGKGAVYMMTNEAEGNEIAVFARDKHGLLEWNAITSNGKYAYTLNTASASISAIALDSNTGTLTLLNPDGGGGLTGLLPPGSGPTDATILGNEVLYVNVGGTGQIAAFTIEKGGALTELFLSPAGTLPDHANGLVVR